MSHLREASEQRERDTLCSQAALSADYQDSRAVPEAPCAVRTAFQRDCHRVVHSKAFRRLRGKTQVFLWPKGDHYRTRLTHVMEVAHIARTLARALRLNEDLTETIALAHDIGHTPFGHAGEDTHTQLHPAGFRHEQQSLRIVAHLERDGRGLNLTAPVLDSILNHSKGAGPLLDVPPQTLPKSLEGQIVRIADLIAYVHHDLDDALRAKVIKPADVPPFVRKVLGDQHSGRLSTMISDVVATSLQGDCAAIKMTRDMAHTLEAERNFLYDMVYYNESVHAEFRKTSDVIARLWHFFLDDLDRCYQSFWPAALRDGSPEDDVRDFIAGMTDAYAINLYDTLFIPRRWFVL